MDSALPRRKIVDRRTLFRSAAVLGVSAGFGSLLTRPAAAIPLDDQPVNSVLIDSGGGDHIHTWIAHDGAAMMAGGNFITTDPERRDLTGRIAGTWRNGTGAQTYIRTESYEIFTKIRGGDPYVKLGDDFSSSPVAIKMANGNTRLFSLDRRAHVLTTVGTAAGTFPENWTDLGGNPFGYLATESLVAIPAGETIWLVGHDELAEQFVAVPFRNGELGVWTALNGVYPIQRPGVVLRSTGTLQITMRTAAGQVRTQLLGTDGSQSSSRAIDGIQAAGSVSTVIVNSGRTVVLTARDRNNQLHMAHETTPGAFTTWRRIASNSANSPNIVTSDPTSTNVKVAYLNVNGELRELSRDITNPPT